MKKSISVYEIIGITVIIGCFFGVFGIMVKKTYDEYRLLKGIVVNIHHVQSTIPEPIFDTLIDEHGNEIPITPEISKKLI